MAESGMEEISIDPTNSSNPKPPPSISSTAESGVTEALSAACDTGDADVTDTEFIRDNNTGSPAVASEDEGEEEEQLSEEELRLLKIRKKQELKLVRKYDKSKLYVGRECWFLIDSNWLNKWSAYVNGDEHEPEPGPISSKDLLNPKTQEPLPGLRPIIDYRGISATVFYILVELHGKDASPDICRYLVDIYKAPVDVDRLVNIKFKAMCFAKIQVNKVRPKWVKWEIEFSDDEDEEPPCCGCCGLTKEHLEAFIYWAITCWNSRKKSGRGDISYRKYKPLRKNQELEEEEEEAEERHREMLLQQEERDAEWLAAIGGGGAPGGGIDALQAISKESGDTAGMDTSVRSTMSNKSTRSTRSTRSTKSRKESEAHLPRALRTPPPGSNRRQAREAKVAAAAAEAASRRGAAARGGLRGTKGAAGRGASSGAAVPVGRSTANPLHEQHRQLQQRQREYELQQRGQRLQRNAYYESSSSSSSDEEEMLMTDAPADVGHERGTWLMSAASTWYGGGAATAASSAAAATTAKTNK